MAEPPELLPPPPFDFDREALVDSEVQLNTDLLKETVAWLVDCIRQQSRHLQSHDLVLDSLGVDASMTARLAAEALPPALTKAPSAETGAPQPSATGGTQLPKDEEEASPAPGKEVSFTNELQKPAPSTAPPSALSKSVTKQLETTMKDELLQMKLDALQHELNTLPKVADLDRQRENLLAEVAVMSSTTEQRMKEGEEKLESDLGSATNELRERLQRIGDDMLERLASLEMRTAQAESSAEQAKEDLLTIEQRLSVRIETVQAASQAHPLGGHFDSTSYAASDFDNSTLVGTARSRTGAEAEAEFALPRSPIVNTEVQLPKQAPSPDKETITENATKNETSTEQPTAPQKTPSPRHVQIDPSPRPTTPADVAVPSLRGPAPAQQERIMEGLAEPNIFSQRSPESHYSSTNATYVDNAPQVNLKDNEAIGKNREELCDLRESLASIQAFTRQLETRMKDVPDNLAGLEAHVNGNEHKLIRMETHLESYHVDNQKQFESLQKMIGELASTSGNAAVEAMRKEWMHKAACRGPGLEGIALIKMKEGRARGQTEGSSIQSKRRTDSGKTNSSAGSRKIEPKIEPNVEDTIAGEGNKEPEPAASQSPRRASSVVSEDIAVDTELQWKLDKLDKRIDTLQNETTPLIKGLDSTIKEQDITIKELQQVLLPEEGPALASVVLDNKCQLGSLQKWSKDMEKRFRRIAPLDSEFSDVQVELERLRKLFEFVQKVLPSDASKAMAFFNKKEDIEKVPVSKRNSTRNSTLVKAEAGLSDVLKDTLGPEVAFQQHTEKLSEDVRQTEQRMAAEHSNLVMLIKSLQKEIQQTGSKTSDCVERLACVEKKRVAETAQAAAIAGQAGPAGTAGVAGAAGAAAAPAAPAAAVDCAVSPQPLQSAQGAFFQTELEPDRTQMPVSPQEGYVSKTAMKKALEETKDDVRNWLDVLHTTTVSALQQKADNNKLESILAKLQKASGAGGLATEDFAVLAKRALLGRCASCDANFNVDPNISKRPWPVNKPSPWPNQPAVPPGASQIRPPIGAASVQSAALMTSQTAPGKLPQIPNARTAKDFKPGRIFKNVSQPDLRQVRTLEQTEE